ncbi:MAG: hypothetical protein ACRDT6_04875 [Micromonosporaceae bacterium]
MTGGYDVAEIRRRAADLVATAESLARGGSGQRADRLRALRQAERLRAELERLATAVQAEVRAVAAPAPRQRRSRPGTGGYPADYWFG